MVKVQAGLVQGDELTDKVPVLSARTLSVALVDSTQRHSRGKADANPVRPDFLGQSLGDLDHEPGAIFYRSAVGVGAVVGVGVEELVQEAEAAAGRNSAVMARISSMLSSRGVGVFCNPIGVNISWSAEIADGATGGRPCRVLSG